MGGASKTTVGYKYYAGFQMVLARRIARILRIRIDTDDAFVGSQTGSGLINIDKPELFGGKAREGGIQGIVSFQDGGPTQMPDPYLVSKLGPNIPASRGVSALIGRQMYLGNNPYMKTWAVRAERIHQDDDGNLQWYDTKAAIPNTSFVLPQSKSDWKFFVTSLSDDTDRSGKTYDDSGWPIGGAPFGNRTNPDSPIYSFDAVPVTFVASQAKVWLRSTINVDLTTFGSTVRLQVFVDNFFDLWINGVHITAGGSDTDAYYEFDIPVSSMVQGANLFAVSFIDTGSSPITNFVYFDMRIVDLGNPIYDMNPAHMYREALLNKEWGYGYDEDDLNMDSFTSAADTYYAEGMGLSYFWNDPSVDLDGVMDQLDSHTDSVLYIDTGTLKWTLLPIRGDYDQDSLDEYTQGVEIISVEDVARPGFMDLSNSVTINFYSMVVSGSASITVPNPALFLQQGVSINTQTDYQMCCNPYLASRLGQRDLAVLSNPLATGTVYLIPTSRTRKLHRGSACKLTIPDAGLNKTVVRVTGLSKGDGKTRRIKVSFVEDKFALPDKAIIKPGTPAIVDPSTVPTPVAKRLVVEVPYFYLIKEAGQSSVDSNLSTDNGIGYVAVSAARPDGALSANLYTDSGSGFTQQTAVDYCAYGALSAPMGYLDDTFTLTDPEDLEEIEPSSIFQIDSEYLSFTGISGNVLTGVTRGLYDTTPSLHNTGAQVFFFDNYLDQDPTQYEVGESIGVKITSITPKGELALADAPTDNVVMAQRAYRPYAPGKLQFNGVAYPSSVSGVLAITWQHRDRLLQSDKPIDTLQASIGPEPGVTYTVRVYIDGTLISTTTGISGTTLSPTISSSGVAVVEVDAVRDSLSSWQSLSAIFNYDSGLDVRVTEAGDIRITEAGDTRILE